MSPKCFQELGLNERQEEEEWSLFLAWVVMGVILEILPPIAGIMTRFLNRKNSGEPNKYDFVTSNFEFY